MKDTTIYISVLDFLKQMDLNGGESKTENNFMQECKLKIKSESNLF